MRTRQGLLGLMAAIAQEHGPRVQALLWRPATTA
jgi:hypothetical protein